MTNRTAIIIASIGVILSLCVGLFGGAVAGFYVSQVSPRTLSSVLPFSQNLPFTGQDGQSQLTPNTQGPFFRGPGRFFQNGGTMGAAVLQVTANSPAQKAGVQAGDVITAIDGQKVDSQHPLNEIIQGKKPGDTVQLTVQRARNSLTLPVTLGTSPTDSTAPYLGIRFTMFDNQATPVPGNSG